MPSRLKALAWLALVASSAAFARWGPEDPDDDPHGAPGTGFGWDDLIGVAAFLALHFLMTWISGRLKDRFPALAMAFAFWIPITLIIVAVLVVWRR